MAIYRASLQEEATPAIVTEAGERDGRQDAPRESGEQAKAHIEQLVQDANTALGSGVAAMKAFLQQRQQWELFRMSKEAKRLGHTYTEIAIGEELERRKHLTPEEARREAEARDEISERTGKPKRAPRGKPFGKGQDKRRNGGSGEGEGEGEGEQGDENEGDEQEGGETPNMPKLPQDEPDTSKSDTPVDEHIRKIARQEDAKLARLIDANFVGMLKHIASVEKRVGKGGGGTITVKLPNLPPKKIEGLVHALFADILDAANGFINILLVGPAGSGKTTLAKQVADALGRDFAAVSCSVGMSESALTGRLLPTGEAGRFEYSQSEFVRLYENGGVFLLDEIDAADPNVMIVVNSALANGILSLPARISNPSATRHENFVCIAAANTFGHGANRMYVGRNQLDAATLDRFVGATFEMDYDRTLEAALTDDEGLLAAIWGIRDKIATNGMRRVMGTRAVVAGATWRAKGKTLPQVLDKLTVGWTDEDRAKVGLSKRGGR